MDPAVALVRFGCCGVDAAGQAARELLRHAQFRDPALGFPMTLGKAREGGA